MSNFLCEELNSDSVPPPTGDFIKKMPRKVGSVTIVNLGSIINWVMTEQLIPYFNNRGCGRLSKKTFESAYSGVEGDSLGECTYGLVVKKGVRKFVLTDFHSRLGGFLKRWVDGKMSPKELKTTISVRVVANHLKSYQKLNAGDPHRTKDKIKNPDLAYGVILKEIRESVGEESMAMIGDNKWTILSSVIYNMGLGAIKDEDWIWPQVYKKRGDAMKIADKDAGHIKVSPDNRLKLIYAIQYWHKLMKEVETKAEPSGIEICSVTRSAGLFGFIICDRMCKKPHFSTQNVMINKIMRNLVSIRHACPELCRGNRDAVKSFSLQLAELFKHNKKQDDEDIAA